MAEETENKPTVDTTSPVIPSGTTNTVEKIVPQSVPSEYASLGVQTGYAPTPVNKLRMFIVGPSGEGKTTFLSGIPRTLILDFERGANGIPYGRAHRLFVSDPVQLRSLVDRLVKDARNPNRPYDRIGIDTIDQMVEFMNPVAAAAQREKSRWTGSDITEYGDGGAGWAKLRNSCWSIIQELEKAGYTWTVLGHITEKNIKVNRQDRTVPRPVLFDSFARLVGRNCEVFAAIYSLVETEKTVMKFQGKSIPGPDKEVIHVYMDVTTINSEKNTGQGKLRNVPTMTTKMLLPYPMTGEYGWDVFAAEYESAVEKVKKQIGTIGA